MCGRRAGDNKALKTTGAYLPGATIGIQAEPPIISVRTSLSTNPRCRVFARPVPTRNWRWEIIEQPAGSTSRLAGGNQLQVTLLLDRVGVYKIRFIACPSGCAIKLPDQTSFPVEPNSREVVVRVLAILPPQQSPVLPRSAATATSPTSVPDHCGLLPDYLSAAWRTVKPWSGANDYRLLEGEVVESIVSATDNDLNHYSQDWNIEVRPDPKYRELLNRNSAGQNQVEVEWERDYLPETYRPTKGDQSRRLAIGYTTAITNPAARYTRPCCWRRTGHAPWRCRLGRVRRKRFRAGNRHRRLGELRSRRRY